MRALLEYAENFEVDALTARLFFVYGPPEAPGPDAGFNATLFSPLAGVEKVSRPRGLDQKGDWTYVKDAAQGICLMLQAQGLRDRAFNIATGIFHPLKGIMETITRHARCDPQFDIGAGSNLERGAPLDITRAQEQLGHEPEFDLESGVADYAQWFSQRENGQ